MTQPILPQLEEIVASLQQSKEEKDDELDANWGDEPSERKQDHLNRDSQYKHLQMKSTNRG